MKIARTVRPTVLRPGGIGFVCPASLTRFECERHDGRDKVASVLSPIEKRHQGRVTDHTFRPR